MTNPVARLIEYCNASDTMSPTHKGTPHASNDKPLHLADIRALVRVVEADTELDAHYEAQPDTGSGLTPDDPVTPEMSEWASTMLALVARRAAALRAATEATP